MVTTEQVTTTKQHHHNDANNDPWKLKISTFPQLGQLSDDLILSVLSFVADVPFEEDVVRTGFLSTLTHVLPLVSKHFHMLCCGGAASASDNIFWKAALERLVQKEQDLWGEGLMRLLPAHVNCPMDDSKRLVEEAVHSLESESYFQLFQTVVRQHLRYTGPIFYMPGRVRLGHAFGLHFFEPRYRLLISEVMANFPVSARRGEVIEPHERTGEYPTFIYAHTSPLAPTSPACLVQVQQCLIHPNGTADVALVTVAYVWLERIWERPGTGALCQAQCLRMNRASTLQMEAATMQLPTNEIILI